MNSQRPLAATERQLCEGLCLKTLLPSEPSPLTKRDAREMIKEIKGYPILEGYRGQEPADVPFLEGLLVKVSDFVDKNPQIKELDLNPILAYKDGAVAVDARVILEDSA